jgi:hypothetical protein
LTYIANRLNVQLPLLKGTLEKCILEGRVTEDDSGIHIANWARYQSEYDRQKPYREAGKIKLQQALNDPEFMAAFNRELDTLEETLPLLKEEDLESV